MPDGDLAALASALLRAAEAQIEAMNLERGITSPGVLAARPTNAFEAFSHVAGDAYAFATGYDSGSGTTTMAFTTDVSILTDGSSGDILTGS